MSYEGYLEVLCENGHLNIHNENAGLDYDERGPFVNYSNIKCPDCKSIAAFVNCVDATNGPPQGAIDFDLFEISPQKVEKCNLGHFHIIKPAVYRIPTKDEAQAIRSKSVYETK